MAALVCRYCASPIDDKEEDAFDETGAPCCEGCYCPVCRSGHYVTPPCEPRGYGHSDDPVDPDHVYDMLVDASLGI